MRKAISTVVVACVFVAGTSGIASAGQSRVSAKRCGTKYTAACTTPKIVNKPTMLKCIDAGSKYVLPTITLTSNSGIRRAVVSVGTRNVKVFTFKGRGRPQYLIKSLGVSTAGLGAGGHSFTVKVTDIRGRTATKTLHFSICVATPVFTG